MTILIFPTLDHTEQRVFGPVEESIPWCGLAKASNTRCCRCQATHPPCQAVAALFFQASERASEAAGAPLGENDKGGGKTLSLTVKKLSEATTNHSGNRSHASKKAFLTAGEAKQPDLHKTEDFFFRWK